LNAGLFLHGLLISSGSFSRIIFTMPGKPHQNNRIGGTKVPPAVLARNHAAAGDALYAQGKYKEAAAHFQECIRLQPADPDYHYRVANTAWKLDQPPLVEAHFLHAVRLDPRFAEAHKMLAQFFLSREQTGRAMYHSGIALELAPGDADTLVTRAVVLTREKHSQAAWKLLEPLIAASSRSPHPPDRHLASAYAWLAPQMGHETEAAAVVERALQNPGLTPKQRRLLHVDAATLLERVASFPRAMAHMRQAKALVVLSFDAAAYSRNVSTWLSYFTKEKLQSLPRATHGSRRPVFIVGMPRSGTSLIEQILASHPGVHGGGELTLLSDVANSFIAEYWKKGAGYPQCVDLLSTADVNRVGGEYLAGLEALNRTARYVTNKMPQSYEFLGVAELILPEARVIHCRRDPRDTCLSCFLTDFDAGNAFSLNLGTLASYYRDYRRQMKHWKAVSSLAILDVRYEEVVADLPGQTRRMLEFLELPWDDRCVAFHESKRRVATASRDQVRRPIYTSSIGRWKRYEGEIAELLKLAEEEAGENPKSESPKSD
jgi:hypothetical protein